MKKYKSVLIFGIFIFFLGCELNKQNIIRTFDERTIQLQKKYASDLSLNIFQVSLKDTGESWILSGETTVREARHRIITLADSLLGQHAYENELKLLPDEALGDSTHGIIKISVMPIRRHPENYSEMIDQTIMGRTVRILKTRNSWYLIQTNYGYIGWVKRGSLKKIDQAGLRMWENAIGIIITDLQCKAYEKSNLTSQPLLDLVLNSRLIIEKRGRTWSKVRTPDGKEAYLENRSFKMDRALNLESDDRINSILKTAKEMMGVPYLWGGNSTKANDCSGFTQTVFKASGIQLPRDARQQVLLGKEIIPDSIFSNVKPGDLFFFGFNERITHVGIGLGGANFIHQNNWVQINSLDPNSEDFNAFRKRTFQKIKRIF